MASDIHIPHSLRLAIFLLRIAVGISFIYLGWSLLFSSALATELGVRSFPGLYNWLSQPSPFANIPSFAFAWIFLVTGILITIGLFTRLASLIAALLVFASIVPAVSFPHFFVTQFVNDELVLLFALLVIIFGRAGKYIGLDMFVHVSKRPKQ